MRLLPLLIATAMLAGCQQPREIHVDRGFVRLAAVPGHPAAAYFTVHGGAADTVLISVASEVAIKSEMHESMSAGGSGGAGGMMTMTPIRDLPLPAAGTIRFAPGGRHVMLYDVNPAIKPGGTVPLTFTFSSGLRIDYDAGAIAAGDPAPKP